MRTPRAVNSLIDDLFERKYRKVGQGKKCIRIFFSSGFLLQYRDAKKGVSILGVLRSVGSYHMYATIFLDRRKNAPIGENGF